MWGISNNYPQKMFGRYDEATSPYYLDFYKGKLLDDCITVKVTFGVLRSRLNDYDVLYHDKVSIPMVSSRIAAVLRRMVGDKVQLIKTTVECVDGNAEGFWSLNIVGISDITDLGHTDYVCLPGTNKPVVFHDTSVRSGSLDGLEIGRDRNFPPSIFVTSSLAAELKKNSGNMLRFD